MTIIGNVNINNTQKMYGDFNIYNGKPNYYGQHTLTAGYSYNVDDSYFVNNAFGSQDQICFNTLPLLTNPGSSYTFNIRGGNGNGINNIINTVTIPYLNYNNAGQQPLYIDVSDNYFSNTWVEIYRNDPGNNRVLIGNKRFDVKFSTVGNRESYVNGDLLDFDPLSNSLVFNANSIPANSTLFVYDGANKINPITGNDDVTFTGLDTDSLTYPYSYKIHSGTAFYRDLTVLVINKTNTSDIVTYGNGDYAPLSIVSNNGNYINFQGIRIINTLDQPARLLVRDGYCTDGKYITISSVNNAVLQQLVKNPGADLIIPLGTTQAEAEKFFTADDVYILISDNAGRTINVATKQFDLNSVLGPVNTSASLTFHQFPGSTDYISALNTPANNYSWLLTDDPATGAKLNPIFGNTNVDFFNEYEINGLGYNLAADVLGVNTNISAYLFDTFLRPITLPTNNWIFDNTPPVILTDIDLINGGPGADIFIETVDNPSAAIFAGSASDDLGLVSHDLQLSYDAISWTNLAMAHVGGDDFSLTLGALSYPWISGNIYYRWRLIDQGGNIVYSPINKVADVSISEHTSFMILNEDNEFEPGKENVQIKSIIGDEGATVMKISVFNTKDEEIAVLPIPSQAEGFQDYSWNGYDKNGNIVELGTYYLRFYVKGTKIEADKEQTITIEAVDKSTKNKKDRDWLLGC